MLEADVPAAGGSLTMYRTILVPLDESPLGERALPYAAALARRSGARLLLVEVAVANMEMRNDPDSGNTAGAAVGPESHAAGPTEPGGQAG